MRTSPRTWNRMQRALPRHQCGKQAPGCKEDCNMAGLLQWFLRSIWLLLYSHELLLQV